MLVDFKEIIKTHWHYWNMVKIDNIGGVLAELFGASWLALHLVYTQLICVCLPKIIQFYIINVFKFSTTGWYLATILLSLTQS